MTLEIAEPLEAASERALAPEAHLRPPQAAAYLGIGKSTLAKMRLAGTGPVYSKAGPRIVLYARADLDTWLAVRKRRSTSETVAADA